TRLDGGSRDLEVRVVRRRDADEVDPLVGGELFFRLDHLLVRSVRAFGCDAVILGGGLRLGRVGGKSSGDKGSAVIQYGGPAVGTADKRALAPPDQAHAKLAI